MPARISSASAASASSPAPPTSSGSTVSTASLWPVAELPERHSPQHPDQRHAVHHLTAGNERPHFGDRHPLDALGFVGVDRFTDLLGALGQEQDEAFVGHATHRRRLAQVLQRSRPPSCLFQHLAGGARLGRLTRLESPGRDLPAPGVGDESVPPHEQQAPARVVRDHSGRGQPASDRVVIEPAAVRELDVGQADRYPVAFVHGPFAVHRPARHDAAANCVSYSSAYNPPCCSSLAWLPRSPIRPPSTTRISSAAWIVDSRWAITIEVRPASASFNACWIW